MSEPLCRYYGKCGGCQLQHLDAQEYATTKSETLRQLVTRLGVSTSVVQKLVHVGERSRRRAEFKISVDKGKVSVGFYAAKSHDVVNIDDCPIMRQPIAALIPAIRDLLSGMKKPGRVKMIHVTEVNDGFDVVMMNQSSLLPADRQEWVRACEALHILRLAEKIGDEPALSIHHVKDACITLGDVEIILPLQPFLQATQKGQDAITELVLKHVKEHQKVADIYAGCGTYSFPLAVEGKHVCAYEGNYDMVIAANNAIRRHDLESLMSAETRHLVKYPLKANELAAFDAVVINPPRNGAGPQVKELARSLVKKIVMVSCNPVTFERDARILLRAGFDLVSVTPIDQFYQTNHLELVAVFDHL